MPGWPSSNWLQSGHNQHWVWAQPKLSLGTTNIESGLKQPLLSLARQGTSPQYQFRYLDLVVWYWYSICQTQPSHIQIARRQCCLNLAWAEQPTLVLLQRPVFWLIPACLPTHCSVARASVMTNDVSCSLWPVIGPRSDDSPPSCHRVMITSINPTRSQLHSLCSHKYEITVAEAWIFRHSGLTCFWMGK